MVDDRQGTPMTAAARPHRHRTLLAYAVVPLALAALGACTGSDPGPAVTTPPSNSAVTSSPAPTTTTSSATPSPTATVDPVIAKIPAPARPHTQDGAEAFARFYMEQVNRAFTSADPTALAALAGPDCKTCSAFVAGAKDLKAKGHRHQGLSISVDGSPSNSYKPNSAIVQVFVTQHSVPVIDRRGKQVEQTKEGQGIFFATLTFDKHWVVQRLQVAK